jgi:hypothetical protein
MTRGSPALKRWAIFKGRNAKHILGQRPRRFTNRRFLKNAEVGHQTKTTAKITNNSTRSSISTVSWRRICCKSDSARTNLSRQPSFVGSDRCQLGFKIFQVQFGSFRFRVVNLANRFLASPRARFGPGAFFNSHLLQF